MNPELAKKMIDALESGDATAALAILKEALTDAATGGAASDAPADGGEALNDAPDEEPEEDPKEALASAQKLARELKTELAALRTTVSEITAERNAAELAERRDLVAELVKLGAEVPATAWRGSPDKREPCARLASEPITELRDRVKALSAAGPRQPVTPPPSGAEPITLSKAERAYCEKHGITQEQFAARKAGTVRVHRK